MRVSVVIVNYNGAGLIEPCLDGLEAQTRAPDEVVIVDNGSTDPSVDVIRSGYPWICLVEAGENMGFSAGNNVGIRASSGDIVVLLNNDTVPSPSFIEQLCAPIEADGGVSAVSGVMLFSNQINRVATSGIQVFDNGLALDRDVGRPWRDLPAMQDVFGPTGGAAAFRRSAINDVDLFPEPFFMYLEDVDLAWRLRLRGHRTVSRAGAWVHHVYSASAGDGSSFKDYYLARNRAWVLLRCWPTSIWRRNWWRVVAYELGAVLYALTTGRWSSVKGRIDGWAGFRRLLRVRKRIQHRLTVDPDELLYWSCTAPSVRNIFRVRDVIRVMARANEKQTAGRDNEFD